MRGDFLDKYSRLDSPVHRAPAWGKAAAAFVLILSIVLAPPSSPLPFACIAALLLALIAASGIPAGFFAKRILFLEPFVVSVGVLALFQKEGLARFGWIAARSTLSLATLLLLSNTTPFAELLQLLRRVRVPSVVVSTLAIMYRYIFILSDETQRSLRARRSRSFSPGVSRSWAARSSLLGQMFLRSTGRAERIYNAMIARGWR